MAKNKNGKLFFEVTRDKPVGKSRVLLMGASVAATVSFFIVSVLGALYGAEMDNLVFFFILSSIVGFFVGGFLTWIFVRHFSEVVAPSSPMSSKTTEENPGIQSEAITNLEPILSSEEAEKGQSVDFVFPELSPDK